MAEHTIKLPDVGEGVAEAELVEWHVRIGDLVREDAVLAAVMTDKATVEIPSPVDGEVVWLGPGVGDTVPVGSPIIRLKVQGDGHTASRLDVDAEASAAPEKLKSARLPPLAQLAPRVATADVPASDPAPTASNVRRSNATFRAEGEKPLASPAVRLRAREFGIDLRQVPGSAGAGRITHDDLEAFLSNGGRAAPAQGLARNETLEEVKIVGLRRKIAEKMSLAASRIPHITYVEEIDVTELEALRGKLNEAKRPDRPKLTILPFLVRAIVRAVAEQPQLNATFDDEAGVLRRHGGVHVGIAAQTPGGLMVPVVRHAEARDIWDCGAEIVRLAEAARTGAATRDELTGSTITITSLGAMGGVATTPVINHPEVAIVGVNKIMTRPVWDGQNFVPRKMMNLSSSFDHRVIDGWDAATFVQRIKALLETPALLFVE